MAFRWIIVAIMLIATDTFAGTHTDPVPIGLCGENLTYPQDARKRGIEGTVTLTVDVDKGGNITRAEVIDNPAGLDSFATEAVRFALHCARVRPATDDGVAVEQKDWKMKVTFRCHDKATGRMNCQ